MSSGWFLTIHTSSVVKKPLRPPDCPVPGWLHCLLLGEGYLCVPDASPPAAALLADFHSCLCFSFHSLRVFLSSGVFHLDEIEHRSFFLLCIMVLVSYQTNRCLTITEFSPMFSSRSFIAFLFILKTLFHFELIFLI